MRKRIIIVVGVALSIGATMVNHRIIVHKEERERMFRAFALFVQVYEEEMGKAPLHLNDLRVAYPGLASAIKKTYPDGDVNCIVFCKGNEGGDVVAKERLLKRVSLFRRDRLVLRRDGSYGWSRDDGLSKDIGSRSP
jgi:hypothetical protein